MDSIFKIQKYNKDEFLVIGLEKDNNEYLPEDSSVMDSFRLYSFSNSVTLNLVSSLNSKQEAELLDFKYVIHDSVDLCSFKFKMDSLYQVDHIILPTRDWYDYLNSLGASTLSRYDRVIFYDVLNDNLIEVTTEGEAIIDIPTLQFYYLDDLDKNLNNTIIFGSKYTISTAKMKDAYTKVSYKILSSTSTCISTNEYNSLKQKRDILMMALDTITYSIELLRYFDALKIIEISNRCGWLYNEDKVIRCGCDR